jgi:NADH-quinone oxidoreductase subunit M
MILLWMTLIPFAGGLAAWAVACRSVRLARWTCLGALAADLVLLAVLWAGQPVSGLTGDRAWIAEVNTPWIPALGIGFHLALDGLSLLLVLLTVFLGLTAVLASWTEIRDDAGFFHFNLMSTLTGVIGVFIAMDLFLFYFFWELMLVPMYFLIALWGHERRRYASMKFFLFTQLSGLAMLAAILALYVLHGRHTGAYTFDFALLTGTPLSAGAARLALAGFLAAFLVKLPAVPFHTWLPDAHTEAPTAGSVILAGLLLKTGAYGILRFAVPLFPAAAAEFAPWAMTIAVAGILYGAVLAFAQKDVKRLVAYTSVSHMGFVLLGIFAWNEVALQGAVIQILCHGVSTGALFILCGALQERMHTREMGRMGGLWDSSPRMGGAWLFFFLAALGLPGIGNFVGEFLVLLGAWRVSVPLTVLAALGLVVSTVYAVWAVQKTFLGAAAPERRIPDLAGREMTALAAMMAVILWIGLYPQPCMDTVRSSLETLRKIAPAVRQAQPEPGGTAGGAHERP